MLDIHFVAQWHICEYVCKGNVTAAIVLAWLQRSLHTELLISMGASVYTGTAVQLTSKHHAIKVFSRFHTIIFDDKCHCKWPP